MMELLYCLMVVFVAAAMLCSILAEYGRRE